MTSSAITLLCLVLATLLLTTTPQHVATSSPFKPKTASPTADLSFSVTPALHCPSQQSASLPFAHFSINAKSTSSTPFTRPTLVLDATADTKSDPDAFYDSGIRLQCMIQQETTSTQISTTSQWVTHQQLDSSQISLHLFTVLPPSVIPVGTGAQWGFKLNCLVFGPVDAEEISGYVSIVDVPEPSIKSHTFSCGRYRNANAATTDCLKFSLKLPSPESQHVYTSPQHQPQSPQIQPCPRASTAINNSNNLKAVADKAFTISQLKTSDLVATKDWFIGNTTFIATGRATKLPALAISMSTTQLIDGESRMTCSILSPTGQTSIPLDFNQRFGLYWIAELPESLVPLNRDTKFRIFCEFKARYPGTMHFLTVSDITQKSLMTTCHDPFECSKDFPHTTNPNPDGACVHIKYK